MTEKIVLVTGGFDPLHSGHIKLFTEASKLGDYLFVGLNSDEWLSKKKGKAFIPFKERKCILENLKMIDQVYAFNDDNGNAEDAINQLLKKTNCHIVFANGGDRNDFNVPEMKIFESYYNVEFQFGIGGNHKLNSSSWILNDWNSPKYEKSWGYYRTLHLDGTETKVKELVVNPGETLSMQKHKFRNELWMCSSGQGKLKMINDITQKVTCTDVKRHTFHFIENGNWHQLLNTNNEELRLIEIQYGENCIEEDIQRK